MEENNHDMNKVELDTLLKLKKHERPDEAFWSEFDVKLRQRTLKTLVERTSVRSRIHLKLSSILRPGLAMPAAAAIAVAVYFSFPQSPSLPVHVAETTAAPTAVVASAVIIPEVNVQTQFSPVTISTSVDSNKGYTEIYAQQILTTDEDVYYVASNMTAGNDYGLSEAGYTPVF